YRKLTEEQRAERQRRCEWETRRLQHDALREALVSHADGRFRLIAIRLQIRVLKRYPTLAKRAIRQLLDLRGAHPKWLDEALGAAEENISRKGRAYQWYQSGEIGFYEFLRIALKVYRRHEHTNYDELLADGVDRDSARLYMEYM